MLVFSLNVENQAVGDRFFSKPQGLHVEFVWGLGSYGFLSLGRFT